MSKVLKEYKIENDMGVHVVKEFKGGVKCTLLTEPSKLYIDKNIEMMNNRKLKLANEIEAKKKNDDIEAAIQQQMREDAIEKLKLKGILDENNELTGD